MFIASKNIIIVFALAYGWSLKGEKREFFVQIDFAKSTRLVLWFMI